MGAVDQAAEDGTSSTDERRGGDELLSIPAAAAALGIRDREVRSMIAEHALLAVRVGSSAPQVPAAMLMLEGDQPQVVPGLRGTLIQLSDSGYDANESWGWLGRHNDELDDTPISALRALRTHAVRRAAQSLAF